MARLWTTGKQCKRSSRFDKAAKGANDSFVLIPCLELLCLRKWRDVAEPTRA